MNTNRLKSGTAIAAFIAAFVASAPAMAQQGSAPAEGEEQEIVVSGIRNSLQQAAQVKRDAPQVMDVITAEDVGKLPDANVAEALQRVTGVQITRVFGEGQSVSVRGLQQVRVEVDGRTLLGWSARLSPPENDQLGRSSGLDSVPSGLFGRLEVRKSPLASQPEGGLGGTVNLVTPKPLSFKETTLSVRAQGTYSENSEKFEPAVTGFFTTKEKASAHLKGGAKKVIISAPGGKDVDATIVYGVNQHVLKASDTVISNASCTTNCLAPLVKPLNDAIGVETGLMTTVHAYTNDQVLSDVMHEDLRRARSATMSMIPTKTGAAAAVGLVLPELNGKLDGFAIRVPTINVSLVDLSFIAKRDTTVEEVNALMKAAAEGALKEVLTYQTEPLVSIDFNHDAHSSTIDSLETAVIDGKLVRVVSWYDNEWGFSNRMLDTTVALMGAK